jgi:hypothetical protein
MPRGTCWRGYEQKGFKKKGNRSVPNCVAVGKKKKRKIMPGIEDLIEVFRGETINLNPFYKRGSSLYNEEGKKLVGRYATTSAKEAKEYASSKFPNKVLSAKISPEDFEMGKKDFSSSTGTGRASEYAKEKVIIFFLKKMLII